MKTHLEPDWRGIANHLALAAGELALVGRLVATAGVAKGTAAQLNAAVANVRKSLDAWMAAERAARSGILTDEDLAKLNQWFIDNRPGEWGE